MKPIPYFTSLALGIACLVLSIALLFVGKAAQKSQMDLQKRQNEIQIELQRRQAEVNRGAESDRVGGALVQDMATASLKNDKIKNLLIDNGFTFSANPSPTPSQP